MAKRKGSTRTAPKARVTRRIMNSKRHVVGYIVGGQRLTVQQVRSAAAEGRVAGVRVVGNHVQAAIGARPLSALPTTVERARK